MEELSRLRKLCDPTSYEVVLKYRRLDDGIKEEQKRKKKEKRKKNQK